MIWLLLALGAAPQSTPDANVAPDPQRDIIVTARPNGSCSYKRGGRDLSDHGLGDLARGWPAGQPLKIVVPRLISFRCQLKIARAVGSAASVIQYVTADGGAPAPVEDPIAERERLQAERARH